MKMISQLTSTCIISCVRCAYNLYFFPLPDVPGVPVEADLGLADHDHGLHRGPAAVRFLPELHVRPRHPRPPALPRGPGAGRPGPGRE